MQSRALMRADCESVFDALENQRLATRGSCVGRASPLRSWGSLQNGLADQMRCEEIVQR
jgi:hypothetical protein